MKTLLQLEENMFEKFASILMTTPAIEQKKSTTLPQKIKNEHKDLRCVE
jgi:hypothetical protein